MEFKKGDRVRVKKSCLSVTAGATGTVDQVLPYQPMLPDAFAVYVVLDSEHRQPGDALDWFFRQSELEAL